MFFHELVGIVLEVEELDMLHPGLVRLILGEFPVSLTDATRTWTTSAAINPVHDFADYLLLAFQYRAKADALRCSGCLDAGKITGRTQEIQQVDVAGGPCSGLDPWSLDDKGDTPGCLLYTSPSPRDPKTSRMPSSA